MSQLDQCIKFLTDIQVMKYRLKEQYDELEIMRVLVNPRTMADILGSESVLKYMPEIMGVEMDKVSTLAGFDVRQDRLVPEGEVQFVMRRNK